MDIQLITTLILCATHCMVIFGQTESTGNAGRHFGTEENRHSVIAKGESIISPTRFPETGQFILHNATDPYPEIRGFGLSVPDLSFIPYQTSIFGWQGGDLIATGGSVSYTGLMRVDNGSIGIYQSIGNLHLYAGATANKYGWYNGLQTQFGLNGSVSYRFSPKLSMTLYGTYYFGNPPKMANGMPMPPSMLGYYGYTKFGGYADYTVNDRFGIQVGGQAVKRTYSNKYEFEPIATPYVKVGRKKKWGIGLPVGQILYGILKK